MNPPAQTVHTFGDFEIHTAQWRLAYRGRFIPAEPKVIEVTSYLIENADRVVSKRELLDALWSGVAVVDGVVHRCVSRARHLLGDDGKQRRLIVTHGRRGYQFVAGVRSVRTAGRQPLPLANGPADAAAQQDRREHLVGRRSELATIDRVLRDLQERRRGAVLAITGEPGIGKSRILAELLGTARDRGIRVLQAQCSEVPGAAVFRPWLQILGALAASPDAAALVGALGAGAADIAELVPEVRSVAAHLDPAPALVPEQQRARFLDSAERLLCRAADARPTLVVVDDLHCADEETLSFWRLLFPCVDRMPLLLACAYRGAEAKSRGSLAAIEADVCRGGRRLRLELAALSSTEVEALVAPVLAPEASPRLVPAIHARSQGNPFFARELAIHLNGLARETSLDRVERALDHGTSLLPPSIRAVLSLRIDAIGVACREVLETAAVLGRDFELGLLRAVCERSAEEIDAALDEAHSADLLVASTLEPGRFEFRHVLIRDAFYEGIPPVRRMRQHQRVAAELQSLRPDALEQCCEQLAWHFFAAAPEGRANEAVWLMVAAAQRAARRFAFADAARCYERALRALRLSGEHDRERCCRILLAAADSWQRSGDDARAIAAYREAAASARELDDACLLARAATGTVVRFGQPIDFGSTSPGSPELLEEALAALPAAFGKERALVLSCLCFLLYGSADHARCVTLVAAAEEAARACSDPEALCVALYAKHSVSLEPGNLAKAAEVAEELILVSTGSGLEEMSLLGHTYRAFRHLEAARDATALDAALAERSALAQRLRQPQGLWWSAVLDGTVAMMRGDWRRCDELSHRARDLALRSTNTNQELAFRAQQSQVLLHRGKVGPLIALLRESCDLYPHIQVNHAAYAAFLTALGSLDVGRNFAEQWHGRDLCSSLQATNWLLEAACLTEIASCIGDHTLAAALYDLLLPHRDRNVVVGQGLTYNGPVARLLARLAATLERSDDADRHFEHALARSRAFGAVPWVARIQIEQARMLRRRGKPEDVARSRMLLEEARESGRRIGGVLIQMEVASIDG
ncbi:MAG: AAA family ATPase [Deltaproteobacteria bacterium]|nr:AAA family ATPase [Deltaproteobacteria bacterium]